LNAAASHRPTNTQRDGTSCGFWTYAFTLLLACQITWSISLTRRLGLLGITAIKPHLEKIWYSWSFSEGGLETSVLSDFLEKIVDNAELREEINGIVSIPWSIYFY